MKDTGHALSDAIRYFICEYREDSCMLILNHKKELDVSSALLYALADYVGDIEWRCSTTVQCLTTLQRLVLTQRQKTDWSPLRCGADHLWYVNRPVHTIHRRYATPLGTPYTRQHVDVVVYDKLDISLLLDAVHDSLERDCLCIFSLWLPESALPTAVSELRGAFDMIYKVW